MQNAQHMGQQQSASQQQGSQAPAPAQQQQGQTSLPTQPGTITDWASI